MTLKESSRRIKILRDIDAQKIAAGEVIDRPFSVLRELLDNSLDAGATEIEAHIFGGGIEEIRVIDNGEGMSEEDLKVCWLPHATSKIDTAEDLYKVKTLGFRGEALSSIAAAGKLEITSSSEREGSSFKLSVQGGNFLHLSPAPSPPGTIVSCKDLFYSLPGRRNFLKSLSAETALCTTSFIEKALPFPEISFRYFVDNKMKFFLPPANQDSRISQLYQRGFDRINFFPLNIEGSSYTIFILGVPPELSFHDRKLIQIYVNRRRVWEYSLIQAVEYGYSGILPGGRYPACFIFLSVDPDLVDFNIHPAKREVRFRNLPELHHRITGGLRSHFSYLSKVKEKEILSYNLNFKTEDNTLAAEKPSITRSSFDSPGELSSTSSQKGAGLEVLKLLKKKNCSYPQPEARESRIRYLGQLFSLFLLVERDEIFYIIDQHAAHERILFNKISEPSSFQTQELLVPYLLEVEPDIEELLLKSNKIYQEIGIHLEREDPGLWQILAVPVFAVGLEREIADLITASPGNKETLVEKLYSTVACKRAIKDGEVLDASSALALAEEALNLQHPFCPHGRPLWFELTKKELFKILGRII